MRPTGSAALEVRPDPRLDAGVVRGGASSPGRLVEQVEGRHLATVAGTRTLARGLALRLTAIAIGMVGGIGWLVVFDDGDGSLRDVSGWSEGLAAGRTLSPAERAASADCVSVAQWKRDHDGYPPPFLLVKPVDGGPAARLPFEQAWELATVGAVWTHAACARPTLARPLARSHGSAREGR